MRRARVALCLACLLGLLAGCAAGPQSREAESLYTVEDAEYASPEALSEAVGYPVKTLFTVPMGYRETGYASVGGAALVRYTHAESGAEILLFAAAGGWQAPEPAADCEVLFTHRCGGAEVEARGMGEQVFQAVWNDGDYTYCIDAPGGVAASVFTRMLDGLT